MKIVYDPRHVFYSPKQEFDRYKMVENPETPSRLEKSINLLKLKYPKNFVNSADFPRSYLYLAHDPDYIMWLKSKSKETEDGAEYFPKVFGYDRIFDNGTPILNNSFEMAWISAKCALTGAKILLEDPEDFVYVGTRPPGHHAGLSMGGGYCYMNNVALAAKYLQSKTNGFIAILDLDFHHGNGTQEIFYNDNSVLYISIHGNPSSHFPYVSGYEWEIGEDEGKGYNINFPLEAGIGGNVYLRVLEKCILEIDDYDPDFLLVSFGSDTHELDRMGTFNLKGNDYAEIGRMINQLSVKKLIVQEGGYNAEGNADAIDNLFYGLSR
ncbi:MAG: histone deacetylase family protein [Thermotogae bacterium]|nr:histone deacetylase family protein [Thermotogota bacterium]